MVAANLKYFYIFQLFNFLINFHMMRKFFVSLSIILVISAFAVAQGLPVVMNAGEGTLGADFELIDENGIQFVRSLTDYASTTSPGNDSKVITFSVPFVEKGNYHFYAKVRVGAGNYNDDSFYFGKQFGSLDPVVSDNWYMVNGIVPVGHSTPAEIVTGLGSVGTLTWKWINISQYMSEDNPVVFSVDDISVPLQFCIGARENGLDIAKIAFGKADLYYSVQNLENIEKGVPTLPGTQEENPDDAFKKVKTFINPIMPGDHPDLTLFKDGNNFYSCGSNFHFVPYLPILHSTDLVHWKEICRVIPASWNGIISDAPQAGTWAGVITYFYGSYWIYFSNTAGGGQYFCKANNPAGPWTLPVKMNTTSTTGVVGYDNSVFVDDDGTPYMLIKHLEFTNRIQEIGRDGHLVKEVINLDFINADKRYSWAEGPVMCKRDGWYYYFIAGNVAGGQYVLRARELTENQSAWEELGNFFENVTDAAVTFRSPNHISQPFQLADGTWWTISHSYENRSGNDWSGKGRQGLLHQINWDINGKPTGKAPTSTPQVKPNLPKSGIPWKTPRSDYFENDNIELSWHFMNRKAATQYNLTEKPGWLTLLPGSGSTHILHKEARHHYSIVTKIDFDAEKNGQEAGIYFTNGNQSVTASVYSAFNNGRVLGIKFGTQVFEVENVLGNELWLKAERIEHQITGYYSHNGLLWIQIANPINVANLDKGQENYNWWVGTSNGLYAKGKKAHFDSYAFQDGFSVLSALGYNNYFGLQAKGNGANRGMVNTSEKGGWLMLAGVELGQGERIPVKIEVEAASTSGGKLEVWIDDLEEQGIKVATINVTSTGGETSWETFSTNVSNLSGQHDIYLRWNGPVSAFILKNIRFRADDANYTVVNSLKRNLELEVYPNPVSDNVTIKTSGLSKAGYEIFSLSGASVLKGEISGYDKTIDVSQLSKGVYFLSVNDGNKAGRVKFVKR
jgi:xylan 1,4-beta-xylosidase